MIARRALLALALLPASAAAQVDPVAHVNPELRQIARILLRADAAVVKAQPAKSNPTPVPPGVTKQTVPGLPGQPPVDIFLVNATPGATLRGAILYIHGGGFVAGDARDNLRALSALAGRLGCAIASVQYRLAPGTPFPGALNDNYAALKWLHDNAGKLGVDPARLVVMGESAGGGHAAMLTIAARDRREVPIAAQVLVYPMLDDRTGSVRPVPPTIGTLVWHSAENRKGWSVLLGRPAGSSRMPSGAVPARVADLHGLPPTFIGVGSIDLFASEDTEFARRLIDAQVPTELLVVPGAFHGFQLFAPQASVSRQFNAAIEGALARGLSGEKWK